MIALIQRVTMARVQVAGRIRGEIAAGLLALIGVERNDATPQVLRLLERLLDYRVFADAAGRMNRSLRDTAGGLLLVPQFTLLADTSSGNRPGFSGAAVPEQARARFGQLLDAARAAHAPVAAGEFGAHMELTLTNDGPVTFWLEVPPAVLAPAAAPEP
ncbi:MAG TPA: D-aminoacyl-tRNA deacylase [Steroidobacteraceae bacterium]|nr:D-aminoacyl-tRNA deacylase [Steroidobacteraceae bacterium]